MALNTLLGAGILAPELIGQLVVQPVAAASAAFTGATVITAAATNSSYRIPIVTADPAAAWVPEGGEITADDAAVDELDVHYYKVAALSVVSRELVDDSDPAAQTLVGQALARDLARKIDAAWFAAATTNGPAGLASTGHQSVDTGPTYTNLDAFAEALSKSETVGANITGWYAPPATVLALSKLKDQTDSNRPLLGTDPTQPTARIIHGRPLVASPAVAAGDVWAVDMARNFTIVRSDVTLDVDRSRYFELDSIAIRSTMRLGFGFPHPQANIRLYDAA